MSDNVSTDVAKAMGQIGNSSESHVVDISLMNDESTAAIISALTTNKVDNVSNNNSMAMEIQNSVNAGSLSKNSSINITIVPDERPIVRNDQGESDGLQRSFFSPVGKTAQLESNSSQSATTTSVGNIENNNMKVPQNSHVSGSEQHESNQESVGDINKPTNESTDVVIQNINPVKTSTTSSTKKRKLNTKPKRGSSKKRAKSSSSEGDKNSGAEDTDESLASDDEEYTRDFSKPSRRSLKKCPEFSSAYYAYSKAIQEKKAAENNVIRTKQQYDEANLRKEAAEKNLVACKEALYEADLKVECYWNTMYHKLVKYKEINGHCMVPYTRGAVKDPEEKKLGAWVHCQRKNYHNYKKSQGTNNGNQDSLETDGKNQNRMKPQRIIALEKLGFVWSFFDTKWNQRIEDLLKYKAKHGHLNIPFKYPENQSLAHWVHNQRRDYNLYQEGKPSQMTPEKIKHLNQINFVWKSDYPRTKRKDPQTESAEKKSEEELWEENYKVLADFHKENGSCSVTRYTSSNRKLCAWLTWQRKQYKLFQDGHKSQLTADRIKRLEDLGFEWIPRNKPTSNINTGAVSAATTTTTAASIVPNADTNIIAPSISQTQANITTAATTILNDASNISFFAQQHLEKLPKLDPVDTSQLDQRMDPALNHLFDTNMQGQNHVDKSVSL